MKSNGYRTKHVSAPAHLTGSAHLTEDQIDDQLLGDLGPPWSEHLAACDLCVSRVANAAEPILDFKAVTLAWGERRSATLPLHQEIARSVRFHPRRIWAAAASVAVVIGAAIPVISHQERQQPARMAATAQMSGETAAAIPGNDSGAKDQIVRDNQMLRAIDRELDASVESPETLGLQPVSSAAEPPAAHPSSMQD